MDCPAEDRGRLHSYALPARCRYGREILFNYMTPAKKRQEIRNAQKVALAEALHYNLIDLKGFRKRMAEIQQDIEAHGYLASYQAKMKRLKDQFK